MIAAAGVIGCGGEDGREPGPDGWMDARTPGVHAVASGGGTADVVSAPGRFLEAASLAGDAVLIVRDDDDGKLAFTRVALKDGSRSTVGRIPGATLVSMDASASVVGFTVTDADDEEGGPRSGLYVGPATGPLRLVVPIRDKGWIPRAVHAEDDVLYVFEILEQDKRATRVVAYDASGRARPTPGDSLVIRSGLEASVEAPSACPPGRRTARACLTVRRLGGTTLSATPITRGEPADISPSGAVVLGEDRGGVTEVRAGARPRRLMSNRRPPPWPGRAPFYAGEHVVLSRTTRDFGPEQLLLAAPGGPPQRFGVPSETMNSVTSDGRRVLWTANACVLVATLDTPAAPAVRPGPCRRTEIALDTDQNPDRIRLDARDRARIRLECVAAPPPGCRGTMALTGSLGNGQPRSFTLPAGEVRRLRVRFPDRVAARIRAVSSDAGYTVFVQSRDPDGRRTTWEGSVRLLGDRTKR